MHQPYFRKQIAYGNSRTHSENIFYIINEQNVIFIKSY